MTEETPCARAPGSNPSTAARAADRLHQDWRRPRLTLVGWSCVAIGAALMILAVRWTVTG